MPLNLYTNEPFNDQPFCEWNEPTKGMPTDSEGAESEDELLIDNQTGPFAD